jgi:sugar lactone lactonase YvrE
MVKWVCCALVIALAGCARAPAPRNDAPLSPLRLELLWRASGLANPESVALSQDGSTLYVSNVNGEGDVHDGNGFISLVSSSGQVINREWVTGLDAPKGIARSGSLLYVADIDRIVVIDAEAGSIARRIAVPGAQFLNDVALAPDGRILAADSVTRRIFVLTADAPEIWLEHNLLESANGLLPGPDRLVVTTMAGRLLAIDYLSRNITVVADGLGEADGVAALGDGRRLVSEWPGVIYAVTPDGAHTTILDTRAERRFINDFLLADSVLYAPNWEPSEVSAYRVVEGAP